MKEFVEKLEATLDFLASIFVPLFACAVAVLGGVAFLLFLVFAIHILLKVNGFV